MSLDRQLGEINTKLENIISVCEKMSQKVEQSHDCGLAHSLRIESIEHRCKDRIVAIKWASAFALTMLSTLIAYLKL